MRSSPNCSRVLPRAAAAQAVLAAAGCRPSARHPPCGSPSLQDGQGRQLQLKYDYVGINGNRLASGAHVLIDGMNTEGLFATVQCQSNNTFHAAYDPAGPADALPLVDLVPFALGSFGSVAKVREYLNPAKLQLTTGLHDTDTAAFLQVRCLAAGGLPCTFPSRTGAASPRAACCPARRPSWERTQTSRRRMQTARFQFPITLPFTTRAATA